MRKGLFAAVLLLATPLIAQERATVNVNLIEVPVTVVSRDGEPVRKLTAANFQLFDDGKPQTIASFDTIDFASNAPVTAISPMNPAARRAFMLLFDLGYSSPTTLARAQEAARKFVAQSVKPRDLVAVATIDPEHFRLLSAFTTDRELIAAAIARPNNFRSNDPLRLTNLTRTFEPADDAGITPLDSAGQTSSRGLGGGGSKGAGGLEQQREIADATGKANAQLVRGRIEKEIDTLGLLGDALRGVPGRKQVVLFSEGFDPKFVRGRDVRDVDADLNDQINIVEKRKAWTTDSDERYGNTHSYKLLQEMAKRFRTSDVVLHAVDIQGVRVLNDAAVGAKLNSNDALYLLARPTGGEVFDNVNNLSADLARLLHRQEVVYVLGFYAHGDKPGKLHDLSVKLVDVPNATASYRIAYAEAANESAAQRTLTDAEIIVSDIPQSGIAMRAVAAAFPGSANEQQVPVIVEMNGADLLKASNGASPAIEVYLYAFDSAGDVRDRVYQKLTLDLAKAGDKLKNRGVKYFGVLSLPPGTYAIKSLVRSADGSRGFARADVVVPKAGEIALAPFFIDDAASEWVTVRGASHDRAAPYPFMIDGRTIVPGTSARDASGQTRRLAVVVRNADPEDVTLETTPPMTLIGRSVSGDDLEFVMQFDGMPADAVMQLSVKKGAVAAAMTALAIQ